MWNGGSRLIASLGRNMDTPHKTTDDIEKSSHGAENMIKISPYFTLRCSKKFWGNKGLLVSVSEYLIDDSVLIFYSIDITSEFGIDDFLTYLWDIIGVGVAQFLANQGNAGTKHKRLFCKLRGKGFI
jgi:hypothetical protein